MGTFLRDVKQGVRQLARRPAFSLAAIGTLALGIGLTTTLFSVVNAVLLRDTMVERPEELVEIYTSYPGFPEITTSYPDFLSIQEGADALAAVTAHSYVRGILSTGDRPQLVTGETITPNYFDVLGLRPARGRPFREDENLTPNSVPVAILSHGLWQRVFNGREDIVGSRIRLSGLDYTVVGVGPAGYTGTIPGLPTDFWVPIMMVERLEFSGMQATSDNDPGETRPERRGTRWLFVKGRLADGRTVEQVRSQVEAVFVRLDQEYPALHDRVGSTVHPAAGIRFHPMLDGYVRAASAGLLAAVGLVLLVACANVANMLLARASSRRRELAIRAAIGAGRGQIIRQLLSEGLVLAVGGGAAGTLLALWAAGFLQGLGTDVGPIPFDFQVSLDGRVLAFAIGVTLATAFIFGLAPAWSASRVDLVPALKGSAETRGPRRRVTLRDALVVAQLALSLVLLMAGALLTRGFLAARATDIGFDPMPISSLSFNLQMNGYDLERAEALRVRVLEAIRALPGVEAASTTSRLPLAPDLDMTGVKITGHHTPDDDVTPIDAVRIGADYFEVVGVPIVAGRGFTEDDIRGERRVAIVNQAFAERYWPNESALGKLVYPGEFDQPPLEIVGVARNHKVRSIGEDLRPYIHLPAGPSRTISLVVRTATPAVAALPMLREAVWTLEPNVLFTQDVSATEMAQTTMAPTTIGAAVMGGFGGLALLLAAIGLYGVIAYAVSLRTREVGIRIALGAARGQVLRMVLLQGGRLALVGLALGTLASLGVGRILSSMLYGVSPFDPVAYGVAAGLLVLVASLANLAPALAAARVDPLKALRRD